MENIFSGSYYAIIPAYIRYNKELKFAERLMYGEITALSNKEGYCFASNRYFAELYGVSQSAISRWISHLAEIGSLHIEVIRNEKKGNYRAKNLCSRQLLYAKKSIPLCAK